jgi:PKD repeat protein
MKRITAYLILILAIHGNGYAQCNAAFQASVQPGTGLVSFYVTSTANINSPYTMYYWSFSTTPATNLAGTNLYQPSITFSTGGTQAATLFVANPLTGSCSTSQTFAVSTGSVPGCIVHPNFSYSVNSFGQVGFASQTTGSVSGTSFTWHFGDSSPSAVNYSTTSHTYPVSGNYNVTLVATNTGTPACQDSLTRNILVAVNPCTVFVNTSPATSSAGCNGSASIGGASVFCNPIQSYTWLPGGASSPTIGNLCPGNYSVMISTSSTGTNCCSIASGVFTIGSCTLMAGFTHSASLTGLVNFTNTSVGASGGATYGWAFGDGTSATGSVSPSHTYSVSGTYIATLTVQNSGACASTFTAAINVVICNLNSGFTFTSAANGQVLFSSNSTGTVAGTTYTWSFGDGFVTSCTCPTTQHTYTNNGIFNVTLSMSNNLSVTCNGSSSDTVLVSNACLLNASFTYTNNGNWQVGFSSTSTGTSPATAYYWNFGDGSYGTGNAPTHVYANNGSYTVSLLAASNASSMACADNDSLVVTVNSNCSLFAAFTHTVGSSGLVHYSSAASGVNPFTLYYWNFGDGTSGSGANVSHAYSNGGAHLVTHIVEDSTHTFCNDTVRQSVNITGTSCTANSGFTMVPATTAHYWNAIPAYPWNITAASWDWGDGTTSNQLYTSHQYSVAATYSVCLTVTASCNGISSTCSAYLLNKSYAANDMEIIYINVIAPPVVPVGISNAESLSSRFNLVPNPSTGVFSLYSNTIKPDGTPLNVYNLLGETVYSEKIFPADGGAGHTIDASFLENGIYFVRLGNIPAKKIIITR